MKVALLETITAGNIGAVARVMKNFGFKELLLINPLCDHLSEQAFQRACHASDLLKKAKVVSEQELFNHFVVGTTSKAFTRKARRQAVTPDQLSFLPENAVLLFGREDNGLPNMILEKCSAVVNIHTGTKYKSLNLSHAVAIILYGLRDKKFDKKLISPKMKQALISKLSELSDLCDREESLKAYLKNVANRSIIYEQEAKSLMGLLRELLKRAK